jgi:hypothetical protein
MRLMLIFKKGDKGTSLKQSRPGKHLGEGFGIDLSKCH